MADTASHALASSATVKPTFSDEEEVVVIRNGWTPKKKNIMLHIILAYLMLLTAFFNVACLYNAYLLFDIVFCKCFLSSSIFIGSLINNLFISNIILHHVQFF